MVLLDKDRLCSCGRSGHEDAVTGEPRVEQIEDPFTGDVHAPGAIIRRETGEVEFTSSSGSPD